LEDGRVEALLDGNIDDVNAVVEWAHGGPANSRVDDIEIKNEVFKDEFMTFEVLY